MNDTIGYMALCLALIAMVNKEIKLIRWLHLISCVFYAIYGFLTNTNPVLIGAILFIGIHIYHLIKLQTKPQKHKI